MKTGDVRGASTDANVFVQLYGSSGETGKVPLRIAENTKNKFERGRTDKFKVEVVDIGKVYNFGEKCLKVDKLRSLFHCIQE